MFVLDTNIILELMHANPDAAVVHWIDSQPILDLYTTTITQAELFYGLALMPFGRRRDQIRIIAE